MIHDRGGWRLRAQDSPANGKSRREGLRQRSEQ